MKRPLFVLDKLCNFKAKKDRIDSLVVKILSMVDLGKPVPFFPFKATSGINASSSDYLGKKLLLYFYPKDNTPGCTQEGQNFRDKHPEFVALNTIIFGISRENITSHEKFK